MNFISKQWIVIAVAFLGIAWSAVTVWAALELPKNAPQPLSFLDITLTVIVWMSAVFVAVLTGRWILKYTLFYRLHQQLSLRTALLTEPSPFTVDGMRYAVTRLTSPSSKRPLYVVREAFEYDSSLTLRYQIAASYIQLESQVVEDRIGNTASKPEPKRDTIIVAEPLKTLRLLVKVLEVQVS